MNKIKPISKGTISWQWSLFRVFALILVIISLTTLSITFVAKSYVKQILSESVINQANKETDARLHEFLDPIEHELAISYSWFKSGLATLSDTTTLLELYRPVIKQLPQCASLRLTNTIGSQFIITPAGIQSRDDFLSDQEGNDWYISALSRLNNMTGISGGKFSNDAICWTLTNKRTGSLITASLALKDAEGETLVIGLDMPLEQFTDISGRVKPSENGMIYFFTESGQLIGYPDSNKNTGEEQGNILPKPINESGIPEITASVKARESRAPGINSLLKFMVRHNTWWGEFHRFLFNQNYYIWIGTIVPQDDFLKFANKAQLALLGVSLIGILFVLILSWKLSKKYAAPIRSLLTESQRIAALQLSPAEMPDTNLSEIRELSQSIEKMRKSLKEHIEEKERAEIESRDAKTKAEESDRLKTTFLATISHELRTPLNAIIGFSQMIKEEESVKNSQEYANIIFASGNHLLNLIEEIFNVSQLESKEIPINKSEFSLMDFFNDLDEFITKECMNNDKSNLEIIQDLPPETSDIILEADHYKLRQIFVNLLNNAIKFTEEGSIEYGYHRDNNKSCYFYVKDTGSGIEEEKRDLIFEPFRQIDDSTTRIHGGLGIGLSITKGLIKLLEGKIWLESEVGKGSTFYFSFPCSIKFRERKIPEPPEIHEKENIPGKTILIVEDIEVNYLILEEAMIKAGAITIRAKNGAEAVKACRKKKDIDLILMDIRMPEMDGLKATLEIRELLPDIPIIAQTAYGMPGDKEKLLQSGFTNYIDKPVRLKELIKMINGYFQE